MTLWTDKPGLVGLLLVLGAILALGCGAPDPPADPRVEPEIYSEARLRLHADRAEVLATIGGGAAVTVGHFNDRLMEFGVEDQGQGLGRARRQVLDRMIDHELIVQEGRRRHPEMAHDETREEKGPYYAKRLLAQTVIRESVTSPGLVSDQEARQYLLEHRTHLEDMIERTPAEEDQLQMAKVLLIDERWRAELEAWRSEQEIVIFEEHLTNEVDS